MSSDRHEVGGGREPGPRGQAGRVRVGRVRDRHSLLALIVGGALAFLFFAIFVALGSWQLKRRVWKLDLIARVERRVHAPPVTAPGPSQWPAVTAPTDEYRRVTATGTFLDDSQTLVQAVTELGAGYWVLTPLREADGSIVLVNRGFVPSDERDRVQPAAAVRKTDSAGAPGAARPNGAVGGPGTSTAVSDTGSTAVSDTGSTAVSDTGSTAANVTGSTAANVTGLLRITEPRGAFLRHNDPAANRWYSRDVQAIAAARGLTYVAPYFIDADATSSKSADGAAAPTTGGGTGVAPVGGLTVITFHNSHLVYAITWYTLALMVVGATWIGIRHETRT
jgi:surfeit locus 1 family protein